MNHDESTRETGGKSGLPTRARTCSGDSSSGAEEDIVRESILVETDNALSTADLKKLMERW